MKKLIILEEIIFLRFDSKLTAQHCNGVVGTYAHGHINMANPSFTSSTSNTGDSKAGYRHSLSKHCKKIPASQHQIQVLSTQDTLSYLFAMSIGAHCLYPHRKHLLSTQNKFTHTATLHLSTLVRHTLTNHVEWDTRLCQHHIQLARHTPRY